MPHHIRWMIRKDYPEVLEIEKESSYNPMDVEDLTDKLKTKSPSTIGMVCEIDNQAVGFMIYALYKKKVKLIRFAVNPLMRRMGIGTSMMNRMMEKLCPSKRTKLVVNAHQDYLGSHLFLKKFGFTAVVNPINEEFYTFSYSLNNEVLNEC